MKNQPKIDLKPNQDFFSLLGATFRLVGESWSALKLNISTFFLLAAVPTILSIILFTITDLSFWEVMVDSSADIEQIDLNLHLPITAVVGTILFAVTIIFWPAMIFAQVESARKKSVDFKYAITQGYKMALPFLGLTILSAIILIAGFFALIVPGFVLLFFLSMSVYIYADKKPGVLAAIKQSFSIVRTNWKIILAMYIVNIVVGILGWIPVIGWIINLVLTILYFCLPAVIYEKIR